MTPPPTFTIRITFSGLCLFVPDTRSNPHRMVVLLPTTPVWGVGKHRPEVDDSTVPTPQLEGKRLVFPRVSPTNVVGQFPTGVVDLSDIFPGKVVDWSYLEGVFPSRLGARVILPAGGFLPANAGEEWTIGTRPDCVMTHQIDWEMTGLQSNQLVAQITEPNGSSPVDLSMTPDSNNVVHLTVSHHPAVTEDHYVGIRFRAPHFPAYYALLAGDDLPLPVLERNFDPPLHVHLSESHHHMHENAKSAEARARIDTMLYTCMVAGAQPGP